MLGRRRAAAAALTLLAATGLATTGLASAQNCPLHTAAAAPATSDAAERLDGYFAQPQDPDAYRALAGLGDPGLKDWDDGGPANPVNGAKDEALLHRLFPSVRLFGNSFPTFEVGACRLEQPISTLKARISALGEQAPYVEQWVRVQQAVFSACLDGRNLGAERLPPPAPTADRALARLQRQDRAYQAASLLFYRKHPQEAAQAFDRIAARPGPHRAYGRYMATAIRAGTEPRPYGGGYAPMIPAAQSIRAAQAILADPAMAEVHPLAYDLIGWIAAHDNTVAAHEVQARQGLDALERPLSAILADPEARRRYADARFDLGFEVSTFPDQAAFLDGAIPEDHTASLAMAEAAWTDPLAAWIVFPASPYQTHAWATVDPVEGDGRLQAELARRSGDALDPSNPWTHEALAWREHRYDPRAWSLVEEDVAAARRCGEDRALAAAGLDLFHQVRAALMYGGEADDPAAPAFAAAVAHLRRFPFVRSHVYGATVLESLRYLTSSGRIVQARSLRDALGFDRLSDEAFMRREGLTDVLILLAEDEDHLVRLLSGHAYDMAGLLDRLSIAELRRLAVRSDVATEDRATVSRLAWTRTYALGRPVDPALDRLMRTLNPDITATWRSRPGAAAKPANHVVLRDVLATPALNIYLDVYGRRHASSDVAVQGHAVTGVDHNKRDGDDWWCPLAPKAVANQETAALYGALVSEDRWYGSAPEGWSPESLPSAREALASSFVMQAADPAELAALARIESAPKLLTERTLAWVRRPGLFGSRDGQAEALAQAIQTTRWGCDWAGRHGAYSHAAFDALHGRFPGSQAEKETRYWYDCNGACQSRSPDLPPEAPRERPMGFWPSLFTF